MKSRNSNGPPCTPTNEKYAIVLDQGRGTLFPAIYDLGVKPQLLKWLLGKLANIINGNSKDSRVGPLTSAFLRFICILRPFNTIFPL